MPGSADERACVGPTTTRLAHAYLLMTEGKVQVRADIRAGGGVPRMSLWKKVLTLLFFAVLLAIAVFFRVIR